MVPNTPAGSKIMFQQRESAMFSFLATSMTSLLSGGTQLGPVGFGSVGTGGGGSSETTEETGVGSKASSETKIGPSPVSSFTLSANTFTTSCKPSPATCVVAV